MTQGVIIAKGDSNVAGLPEELYVDPTTTLVKVMQNVTGTLSTDGTTVVSKGDYTWIQNGKDGSNRYQFELIIPLAVNYIPQFSAYMDQKGGANRVRLSNYISGVGLEGDLSATVFARGIAGTVTKPEIHLFARFITPNTYTAGEYGYFIEIDYDRIQRKT